MPERMPVCFLFDSMHPGANVTSEIRKWKIKSSQLSNFFANFVVIYTIPRTGGMLAHPSCDLYHISGGGFKGGGFSPSLAEFQITLIPSLSTFVSRAISIPSGFRTASTSSRDDSVTTAMVGPTELIATNSNPASLRWLIYW